MFRSKEVSEPTGPHINWPIALLRSRGRQVLRVMIVSDTWYGFQTHFHDGRTVACCGADECLLCESGQSVRWAGTIVVWQGESKAVQLFPFTQAVLPAMQECFKRHGQLVGVIAEFGRRTGLTRSAMTCTILDKRVWKGKAYNKESLQLHTDRIFGCQRISKTSEKRSGRRQP